MPIGNITSQIFANIFLDKLDWFVVRQLEIRHYFRYADDFVIVGQDPRRLAHLIPIIEDFLEKKLELRLHERKVEVRKFSQGIDFLGYVVLPHYIALRTKTKVRMLKRVKASKTGLGRGLISKEHFRQSLQSYYGMLKHCNGYKLKREIQNL